MLKPELTATAKSILEQNYTSNEPIRTLVPLKGGEWSAAYRFSLDGKDYVLRLSHTCENFYRDKVASQWSSPAMPVPRIIKIDRHQNHYYAISTFFSGEPLEKLSTTDLEQTIPVFLSMMAALQTIKLDTVTGFGSLTPEGQGLFSSWSEALLDVNNDRPENLTFGWRKALAESPEALQKVDQLYEKLINLVQFCPEQKHLIHSDLLYQNLLVNNHQISAVLDWGCAMIGDPAYDLAIFAFFEPWYPAFTKVNLIQKMQQSYFEQSPDNHHNFNKRTLACQIHLTLGNIAFCALSKGKFDFREHINRLEEVLGKSAH